MSNALLAPRINKKTKNNLIFYVRYPNNETLIVYRLSVPQMPKHRSTVCAPLICHRTLPEKELCDLTSIQTSIDVR